WELILPVGTLSWQWECLVHFIPNKFFKDSWSVVGDDVCKAVRDFFSNGKLLKEINATVISLVPKVAASAKVSDYRPIACCNVVYKIISKVICNGLKGVLGFLVDDNQSAFIPSRQISNNIMLSQELMRYYHKNRDPAKCAFKIDIKKAYDSVEWVFLSNTLKHFGFPEVMVKWIMNCVTFTSFTVNVNGNHIDFFKGMRGLRQGDPLSPYLFTLVMEVFNLVLRREIDSNLTFRFHWQCKELKLTHLYFADDLLLFCNGDSSYVDVLKNVISIFGGLFGLLLILLKVQFSLVMLGKNGAWVWPCSISNSFDAFFVIPPPVLMHDKSDVVRWKSLNGKLCDFSVSTVWDDIRSYGALVPWAKIIWFSLCIPRHSFMLWLALLDRLKTHDNMRHLDKCENLLCVFCGRVEDSREWLKFTNHEFSADSRKEFRIRHSKILMKEIEKPKALDIDEFSALHKGIYLQNLNQSCDISYTEEDKTFTSQAWNRLDHTIDLENVETLVFQLRGVKRSMTMRQFILALRLHTPEEMGNALFEPFRESCFRKRPNNYNLAEYFINISTHNHYDTRQPPPLSYTSIRSPISRLAHQLLTLTVAAKIFTYKAKGYKKRSLIVKAHLIGKIAMSCRLMTPGSLRSVTLGPETSLLNVAKLLDFGICRYNGLGYGELVNDIPDNSEDEGAADARDDDEGAVRCRPNMSFTNRLRERVVREYVMEFLSSFTFRDHTIDLDNVETLVFQLRGVKRSMTMRQFILALRLHTPEEMGNALFEPFRESCFRKRPNNYDLTDPIRRLAHQLLTLTVAAKIFTYKAKGYKKRSLIVEAHLIGKIIRSYGLMTPGSLRSVTLGPETSLLNVAKLLDLGICRYNGLGYGELVNDIPDNSEDEGAADARDDDEGGVRCRPNMSFTNRLKAMDERLGEMETNISKLGSDVNDLTYIVFGMSEQYDQFYGEFG
nr:hypothetical protein [Tanacetum cinerariifolium]